MKDCPVDEQLRRALHEYAEDTLGNDLKHCQIFNTLIKVYGLFLLSYPLKSYTDKYILVRRIGIFFYLAFVPPSLDYLHEQLFLHALLW